MPTPFTMNPLDRDDSYKDSQPAMILPGTSEMYDYFMMRGGSLPIGMLFGLQAKLKMVFEGQFFTPEDIEEAYDASQTHIYSGFPFPRDNWQYIWDKFGGMLPVEIKAVKEGTPVPVTNVLFTVRNTGGPLTAFLPGWMETELQHVWYTSGVASLSREVKIIIKEFLLDTSDTLDTLPWQLADFGYRGTTCAEQAALGGAAHLINFLGTDTKPANALLHKYYRAPRVSGFSVPASEHSVTTLGGRQGEVEFVGRVLEIYKDAPILSLVADSYDVYNFCQNIIGGVYRDKIKAGKTKVVVRPDSGNPSVVMPRILDILADKFGFEENSKGYKVLPPCIGIIWGDGMDLFSIRQLFQTLKDFGWAASVLVVGMGGGLLQKINRDTQKVAIKCSSAIINGKEVEVFKDPITDPGKASLRGKVALVCDEGRWQTIPIGDCIFPLKNEHETVFLNGDVTRTQTLDEIRSLAVV